MRRAVEQKWSDADAAEHYARGRFRSERAAERDPRLVERLLRAHLPQPSALVLDAPCGTGRLAPVVSRHGTLVGLDANRPMLERAAAAHPARGWVQGSVLALPFADRSFDAVVCCRLLHHLREAHELERAVRELVRVSRRLVVASFWDAGSWPALRVRLGLKRDEGPQGRGATSRRALAQLFATAGAPVVDYHAVLRFVSQQTFLAALRRETAS